MCSTEKTILKLLKKFNNDDNNKILFKNFSKDILIAIKRKNISIDYGCKNSKTYLLLFNILQLL